ncbi:MAG: hypothetical protein ABSA18_10295 [Dehalococcoidia bacterium]|jgi:hypothetical protein
MEKSMDDEKYRKLGELFHEQDIEKLKKLFLYEPWVFKVTPEYNEQYMYAEEDYNPRYLAKTDSEPGLVHPGLMLNQSLASRTHNFRLPENMISLQVLDEVEWVRAPRVGKTYTVTWELTDVYEKQGKRPGIVGAVTGSVVDEDNNLIMHHRMHSLLVHG